MEYSHDDLRRVLVKVAGEAAGFLRDIACTGKAIERVGEETFKADLESEAYIIDALIHEGVSGRFVTEEAGVVETTKGDFTVLIDPLDGSRNYANCIPWSSVSIAVASKQAKSIDDVVAGVVQPIFYGYPMSFTPEKCYLGGTPIEKLGDSERFLYVYVEHPEAAVKLADIIAILGRGMKIRSLGSAALEIAYVAVGRGKAFIDLRSKLRNIDVAAGIGLVNGCGGDYLGPGGVRPFIGISRVEPIGTLAVFSHDVERDSIEAIRRGPLSSAGQSP